MHSEQSNAKATETSRQKQAYIYTYHCNSRILCDTVPAHIARPITRSLVTERELPQQLSRDMDTRFIYPELIQKL